MGSRAREEGLKVYEAENLKENGEGLEGGERSCDAVNLGCESVGAGGQ